MSTRNTRKTATTSKPGIPDKLHRTIEDVFVEVQFLQKHIDQHTTVDEAVEKVYRKVAAHVEYMYTGFDALEKRLVDLERRIDTLTNTFTNLVRRLNMMIDMKEEKLK